MAYRWEGLCLHRWEGLRVNHQGSGAVLVSVPWTSLLSLLSLLGECAQVCGCNETGMLERLPRCGKAFAEMMQKVDVWKWCNLSEFIV